MDNYYFKNERRYELGEKLSNPNIIKELENYIKTEMTYIKLNSIIDYVIYNDRYLTNMITSIEFYGNTLNNHNIIEMIKFKKSPN